VSPEEWGRWLGTFLSFATVLPAIFLAAELLSALGLFAGLDTSRRGRRIPPWLPASLAILGLASLALPLLWPRYFYPLVWGGLIFLLDPINRRLGGRSLLGEWEQGRLRTPVLFLGGGAVCGLLWESLNYWARVKWIYTVPFFEELKLFEMPLLGFLGFPPFALQCWIFVQTLDVLGLLPRPGQASGLAGGAARLGTAVAASVLVAAAALPAMDRMTFASLYPLVKDLPGLGAPMRAELAARRIRDCFDLREHLRNRMDSALRNRVDLILLGGMGIELAMALGELNVDSVDSLARADPAWLHRKLQDLPLRHRPTPAEVRVWIRRARSCLNSENNSE
jgi:hypothetical protein